MTDYSEDIEVLPLQQILEKKIQVTNTIQTPAIVTSIEWENKTKHDE